MAGIDLSMPEYYDPTLAALPEIPFPGVAPAPTIRRQSTGNYDQGLDMQDGKGKAKNWIDGTFCEGVVYGEGGKMGVDPGMHDSGKALPAPSYDDQYTNASAFWGIPAPIRRNKSGRK